MVGRGVNLLLEVVKLASKKERIENLEIDPKTANTCPKLLLFAQN